MTIPQPGEGFEWVEGPGGLVLRCRDLAVVANHCFTTRGLALREDGTGWDALAASVGSSPDRLLRVRQVHGAVVWEADPVRPVPAAEARPEADAIVSTPSGPAVAVQVADCVPILLADPETGAVAAIHAGWRGVAAGVVDAAVRTMRRLDVRPANLVAALGPSIGPGRYEVGESVRDAFASAGWPANRLDRWFPTRPGMRPHLDLWRAVSDQLEEAGVRPARVHVAALCTATHNDVFCSYRADGPGTGRLAAIICAAGRTSGTRRQSEAE
jgi:YfiH family protein